MTIPETLKILYEDNHLFVLDKPAGLLTQPSGTDLESLEERAKRWLKEKYQKPGNVFLEAIHRLDRPVSGIVVFAKTSKALSRLTKAVRDRQVKKIYRARVEKSPSSPEGMLEHYLRHGDFCAEIVLKGAKGAKRACLHYRVIEEGEYPLIEVELETGRYHQIRCQLAAIGCVILGDDKYGSKIPYAKKGIALQHFCMQFPHPISGEQLTFSIN